jgi:NTP pyrophosphatase (non-canonical NTP hydrolase)
MFIYQEEIKKFVEERNWGRFHNPKDLLLGLVEEVGEFRNIIKWVNDPETLKKLISDHKAEVKDTIGDMFWILSALANACDVDVEEAIKMVIEDNKKRYPVEKLKGDHANILLGGYDGKYKKE